MKNKKLSEEKNKEFLEWRKNKINQLQEDLNYHTRRILDIKNELKIYEIIK